MRSWYCWDFAEAVFVSIGFFDENIWVQRYIYFAKYLYLCKVKLNIISSYNEIHFSDLGCILQIQDLSKARNRGLQVLATER